MKLKTFILSLAALASAATASAAPGDLATENLAIHKQANTLTVNVDFVLDAVKIGANKQMYITPMVTDKAGNVTYLPDVLVNGRNMQYAIERGTLKAADEKHNDIMTVVRRENGKPQKVHYNVSFPMQPWMLDRSTELAFAVDTCGCGKPLGSDRIPGTPLNLNPGPEMLRAYITPQVTALPVSIHEGKARVQFEVDRTELHEQPYRTKNGQRIDNRAELKVIDDSIHYALTDPNVEIAEVDITGYASPESPYLHNEELATGRSRALAEYIGRRYNLPARLQNMTLSPKTGANSARWWSMPTT